MAAGQVIGRMRRTGNGRIAGLVTALLVAAMAVSLAQLTWLLWPQRPADAAGPDAKLMAGTAVLPATAASRSGYAALAGLQLFGQQEAAHEAAPVQADAPDTALNLVLRGLFASSHRPRAYALIAEGGGEERHYRIGDALGGGAVVRDILDDRVILERDGRQESLRLPRERLAVDNARTVPPAVAAQVRSLYADIRRNPQSFMQMASLQSVMENGRLRGYRVVPRHHQELFRAVGLNPEDVVTHINGVSILDPAQFTQLASQLGSATSLSLSLLRPDGMSDEIYLDLN